MFLNNILQYHQLLCRQPSGEDMWKSWRCKNQSHRFWVFLLQLQVWQRSTNSQSCRRSSDAICRNYLWVTWLGVEEFSCYQRKSNISSENYLLFIYFLHMQKIYRCTVLLTGAPRLARSQYDCELVVNSIWQLVL